LLNKAILHMHEILLTLLILKENEVVRMNSYKAIKLALGSGGYFGFAHIIPKRR